MGKKCFTAASNAYCPPPKEGCELAEGWQIM